MNIKKLVCIVITFALFLTTAGCGSSESSSWVAYTKSDVLAFYNENKDLFDELVQIIINDDDFFEKGRNLLDDGDATICSREDENLSLFSEPDRQVILNFLEFKPYMITYDSSQDFVKITFIGLDEYEGFSFLFWIGSSGQRNYKGFLYYLEQFYSVEPLSDGWIFYYSYK